MRELNNQATRLCFVRAWREIKWQYQLPRRGSNEETEDKEACVCHYIFVIGSQWLVGESSTMLLPWTLTATIVDHYSVPHTYIYSMSKSTSIILAALDGNCKQYLITLTGTGWDYSFKWYECWFMWCFELQSVFPVCSDLKVIHYEKQWLPKMTDL